jgi:hypothetical protein
MNKTYKVISKSQVFEFSASEFAETACPVRSALNAALGMAYKLLGWGCGSRVECDGEFISEYYVK